ncbi:capsule biosynthesis protein CapA [bacterium BMS3Abin03]|nr:capsule biosynthesis protein CapA [bacterium BMS3Abin03]
MNQDNNHSEDYGYEGYKFTQEKLSALGIKFMPKQGFAEFTIGTKHIAIAAFGYSSNSNNISDLENAKKIISGLDKKYDLIIVSFHGGAEGKNAQHVFDSTETFLGENRGNVFAFAHTVIDAGADLVIGHGPHVLRAVEIYKQKLIAYSLGNFLTYGNINTGGISGIAVILDVEIDSTNGNFVRGKLLPVKQVGYGIPEYDINNEGINLIRSLTENDFPNTKLLITPDGKIYYTGFGKISFRFFDDGKEDVFEIQKVPDVKPAPIND